MVVVCILVFTLNHITAIIALMILIFILMSVGIDSDSFSRFMATGFMCFCFCIRTDDIHYTFCSTCRSSLNTVINISVCSLSDDLSSGAVTYGAGIGSYTVCLTGCLGSNLVCFGMLDIYCVTAGTGICMIRVVLIGMSIGVSDSLKLSSYCKVLCNVSEFSIPACELIVIIFVIGFLDISGSRSVITADNGNLSFFTVDYKCNCVRLK